MDATWAVRQASQADQERLNRFIQRVSRLALRFSAEHLGEYLTREPFLLAERAGRLQGFLSFLLRLPPQAALVAAGLADGVPTDVWLDRLLPLCVRHLRPLGATALSYTGSAVWLADALQERGFQLISHIITFEKTDLSVAHAGNQGALIRPVERGDFPALVAVDAPIFHPRWRNSVETLQRWAEILPYFVVAEAGGSMVGYCYCSIDEGGQGYLIRVAVHPESQGQGIGTRLLAEATGYFQQAGARSIILNTQEENETAQRLYRRLGFRRLGREAMALWMEL
jgi:ribosomal protein S18 acetylase RimI-like enzyme